MALPFELTLMIAESDPETYTAMCKADPQFARYALDHQSHFKNVFAKPVIVEHKTFTEHYSLLPNGRYHGQYRCVANSQTILACTYDNGKLLDHDLSFIGQGLFSKPSELLAILHDNYPTTGTTPTAKAGAILNERATLNARNPSVEIPLFDNSISFHHLKIQYREGNCEVRYLFELNLSDQIGGAISSSYLIKQRWSLADNCCVTQSVDSNIILGLYGFVGFTYGYIEEKLYSRHCHSTSAATVWNVCPDVLKVSHERYEREVRYATQHPHNIALVNLLYPSSITACNLSSVTIVNDGTYSASAVAVDCSGLYPSMIHEPNFQEPQNNSPPHQDKRRGAKQLEDRYKHRKDRYPAMRLSHHRRPKDVRRQSRVMQPRKK